MNYSVILGTRNAVNLDAQRSAIVVGDLKNEMTVVVSACQQNKCAAVLVYQQDASKHSLPELLADYRQKEQNVQAEDKYFY